MNNNNINYALISTSDKSNLDRIVNYLINKDFKIISTGGSYKKIISVLEEQNLESLETNVIEVSQITEYPELLEGRVKTLHPKIAAGILADSKNDLHMNDIENYQIPKISVVVVNLYPFQNTIKSTKDLDKIIENIDIGGHTLIRESFKNYKDVSLLVDPNDYNDFINKHSSLNNKELYNYNFQLGLKGINHVTQYDMVIANYFNHIKLNQGENSDQNINFNNNSNIENPIYRCYTPLHNLKYGCNSHQKRAMICSNQINTDTTINNSLQNNMFQVLQGDVGYINILDAINGWNLVYELSKTLCIPAAASFKHTSPAGVGVGISLSRILEETYGVINEDLTPVATAFIRARYTDPLSSFGDFISISHCVDKTTALLIKREVSDGIIALDYTDEALEVLKSKRDGKYIILKVNQEYIDSNNNKINDYNDFTKINIKEFGNIALTQEDNNYNTNYDSLTNIVTNNKNLSDNEKIDLIIANVSLKYAQSNNVAFAYQGQLIALAAGQQNRVDCVKLAGEKALKWKMRQHCRSITYRKILEGKNMKKKDINNEIINFIDNNILSNEKEDFLKDYYISMASDAFFPFRDNIDVANKFNVKNIIQPGGSMADENIIEACNEYNMVMCFTGHRMFYH